MEQELKDGMLVTIDGHKTIYQLKVIEGGLAATFGQDNKFWFWIAEKHVIKVI